MSGELDWILAGFSDPPTWRLELTAALAPSTAYDQKGSRRLMESKGPNELTIVSPEPGVVGGLLRPSLLFLLILMTCNV